ncbi:hypothetical protein ACFW9V_13285 [Streptomyces hygroscopicus]|uniref:hypothetical protein n=1 Tax=Streptomyces hygroscopicus TaxID=1912 RepID=UPI0036C024A7
MPSSRPRLLPWPGLNGQPCYLVTDDTGTSYLSRLADEMEAVQLRTGADLLGHARPLLRDHRAGARELRFVGHRLAEALHDALRVAESRGLRLEDGEETTAKQS